MDLPEQVIDNIYSYLPGYLRADLKCKKRIKLPMDQYIQLGKEIHTGLVNKVLGNGYYEIYDPSPKIRLNFNHPIRELIWGFR
jgi:hypothetical protein